MKVFSLRAKYIAATLVVGTALSGIAIARSMPEKPVGAISFEAHSADIGVGYTWGNGKLRYKGKTYRFKIKGGNVSALGYSSLKAHGEVYNLKHLHDFDGGYGAVTAEATLSKGVGGALLENSNHVRLKIKTEATGARLAAGLQGIHFTIQD